MYSHQSPKMSVIVPVYNVEKYLPRCIDSILSQTFKDFELLLIDDGSPDNCGKICDEYAAKDRRVRVFHKPNGGVSSARNLGLDKACGDWITFIDSDDYVAVDYLEELASFKINSGAELVAISTKVGETEKSVTLSNNQFSLVFSKYKFVNFCPPWGKLFVRELITKQNLRFNEKVRLGEDVMLVLLYLLSIEKITLLSSNKYHYELERPDSLTKAVNSYDTELAGKEEFDRVSNLIINSFILDEQAIDVLEGARKYYTERTLSSIMRLPMRSERISKLKNLDLTIYHKYKTPYSWKERLLLFLLKKKCFLLYDFLINVRKLS